MVDASPVSEIMREKDGESYSARCDYMSNGVIQVHQVFTPSEIDTLRDTFTTQVETDPTFSRLDHHISPDDILSRYPRFVQPHRHSESDAGRLAFKTMIDQRLIKIVQNLIDGPVFGAQSMFYFKPPTARGQALHQDNFFLQTSPETCLAAWIAIDDSDSENGGLIVIPGSHKNKVLCHEEADPAVSFSTNTVKLPRDEDGNEVEVRKVQTVLKAGDVLFFHGSLVHGSMPNRTQDKFRRSLIYHYIPQSSTEVAKFYQPLIRPEDGSEAGTGVSQGGGACGEAWVR